MNTDSVCVELEIKNQKGLHARAAAAFVKTIENFDATVEVERAGTIVSGSSIMGLMMLAASKGTAIRISACGKEAGEVIIELSKLINSRFNEE